MSELTRQKIAVLGGGVGAMTAAYELTETPDWQDQYEITVYQMGWRLGGKGASGRNRQICDRIEEHGLHFWFGYYENAFNLMQRAYKALGRAPHQPLATWDTAFVKRPLMVIGEFRNDRWSQWKIPLPQDNQTPGDGNVPELWELLEKLLRFLSDLFQAECPEDLKPSQDKSAGHPDWFSRLIQKVELDASRLRHDLGPLHAAAELAGHFAKAESTGAAEADSLAELLKEFWSDFMAKVEARLRGLVQKLEENPGLYHLIELLELGCVNIIGILEDHVVTDGFDPLNRYDYREWMKNHGASPIALDSDLIRVAYESIFAYENGDPTRPNLAAGVALRGLLRLSFGWKGAVMWQMQAGMGDTVFAPLYLVLKARGVRFKFFHRVKELGLSEDKTLVDTIVIGEQVKLKAPEYDPLYSVRDLPCWPSAPLYDQIDDAEAEQLQARHINLESAWSGWNDAAEIRLTRGRDFDHVVLGISAGALPFISKQLMASSEKWRDMVNGVPTIQTQAFQLWTKPDLAQLGWEANGNGPIVDPVMGGYAQPLNTWAQMSHLIPRENWPQQQTPGSIAYFCGQMFCEPFAPGESDSSFPKTESARTKNLAVQWITDNLNYLWPGATGKGYPGFPEGFDWNVLIDLGDEAAAGQARFDSQFWRSDVNPSDRYVLSTRGSIQYRLHSGESGFGNLFLAGDWTRNGLDYGCVESAVRSGIQAAQALSSTLGIDFPGKVFGEKL